MPFENLRSSKPVPRRQKTDPIFGVGGRAFVNWPPRDGAEAGPVPLMTADNVLVANNLADGHVVEIVSWRPRAREGLMYQIRSLADGSEWWIAAPNLRRNAVADAAGDAATARMRR